MEKHSAATPRPMIVALLVACGRLPTPSAAQQFSSAEVARMKADYRRPPPRPLENQALVDLGRLLFWDPRVSASSKTACVSCHLPELGWAVTEPRSRNDSGKLTSRKSPTLIGIGHLRAGAPNGWDGRNATLAAQAQASVATGSMSMRETATPVKVEGIQKRIRAIPDYGARRQATPPHSRVGGPLNGAAPDRAGKS